MHKRIRAATVLAVVAATSLLGMTAARAATASAST